MKQQTLPMWLCYFLLLLQTGCQGLSAMTVSEPKVYMQEDVVRALAEYRDKIKNGTGNLPTSTLQEILDAQQITRTDIQNSLSPAGESLVSAPSPVTTTDIQFRAPIGVIKDLGLPARAQLRNLVVNQQLIMGYDLLYKGDSRFLDEDMQVVLLRFDVSINNYLTSLWQRDFAIALFSVNALCDESKPCHDKPHIYALFPEFSAVTAQESLLTSSLRSFANQVGSTSKGVDAKTARRDQSGVQEQFTALTEHPMQFAIYEPISSEEGSHFAFAFGPRRKIEKRALYNPGRWFGDTYTVDYEIEPGPRDLYALLLVPRLAKQVKVSAITVPYLANERKLPTVFEILANSIPKASVVTSESRCEEGSGSQQRPDAKDVSSSVVSPQCKLSESITIIEPISNEQENRNIDKVAQSQGVTFIAKSQRAITNELKPYFGQSNSVRSAAVWTKSLVAVEPPRLNPSSLAFECYAIPTELNLGMTSSVLITCNKPINPDTDIWLGPVSIPKEQITVLNRYQLRAGLAAVKGMDEIARKTGSINWSIVNRGRIAQAPSAIGIGSLTASITTSSPESAFSVKPNAAQPSTLAELTLVNIAPSQVAQIWIGSEQVRAFNIPNDPKSKSINFIIPPSTGVALPTVPLPVIVVINKPLPAGSPPGTPPQTQNVIVDKAFTYIKP